MDADIRELREEIGGLRLTQLRVGGGILVGLVGVIAAYAAVPLLLALWLIGRRDA